MQHTIFDSFVVCETSRVAFSAAVDVAEGRALGALCISGPTGAGKTHLLHAIARSLRARRADVQILHTMEQLSRRGVIVVAAAVVAPPGWHGRTVEVGWPDEGARQEIARRLAAASGISVSDDVLRSLARRGTGNPRELQSAIARLAAESLVARGDVPVERRALSPPSNR